MKTAKRLTFLQEAALFPDWGKMNFKTYPGKSCDQILPDTTENARQLVGKLVVYESGNRLDAEEALRDPYLEQ